MTSGQESKLSGVDSRKKVVTVESGNHILGGTTNIVQIVKIQKNVFVRIMSMKRHSNSEFESFVMQIVVRVHP